ncbi:MAG: rhodanese-like domain-containing protein [Candidatus Zixiibacteriota bacterium]
MLIRQIVVLLALSIVLGVGVNLISPKGIDFIGNYRSLSSGDGPIVPPAAEPGDPPFIAVDVAEMEYSNHEVTFIDSRDPAEFECGTIPGSVNIPFEYLPEENIGAYIDSALGGSPKDRPYIIFCSGEECDLSLHLARNMQALGYSRTSIFFGGAREWEKFGLEMERRAPCEK